MEFEQLIEKRRSIRAYEAGALEEDLRKILDQARLAPSWKNSQTARMYVASSGKALEVVKAALPSFNQKSSEGAALIVTTFVRETSGFSAGKADNEGGDLWGAYDLGLHDAYLTLAASNLGYGSLIMGLRDEAALRAALDIPAEEQVMSVIAVGRPAGEAMAKPRKDLSQTAFFR